MIHCAIAELRRGVRRWRREEPGGELHRCQTRGGEGSGVTIGKVAAAVAIVGGVPSTGVRGARPFMSM